MKHVNLSDFDDVTAYTKVVCTRKDGTHLDLYMKGTPAHDDFRFIKDFNDDTVLETCLDLVNVKLGEVFECETLPLKRTV